ncbi:uncharacterized protein LOC113003084 [Solenopsis invicta]|uniref:uncharacterized protein LOC113003084 n=1 Tax=Solenopsis invicta TaxID=13686 RepID=UPI00193DB0F7|nr:uncharacterized protein LOC113003084 [Solenopsis invicta]
MEETIHMQVEDNSPSIEHILRPISYISWLMGFGVAHPRQSPKIVTIIIRIIHLAVCFINLVYMIIMLRNYAARFNSVLNAFNDIFHLMYLIDLLIHYVSASYYVYYGISQYDKWLELMDRIKELDQKIRGETSMHDQPIRNVHMIAIVATLTGSLVNPILYLYYNLLNAETFLTCYMTAQWLFNSSVFDVIVYVLYCRIQTINKSISQLDKLSDYVPWIAFKIRRIRELHNGICDLFTEINDIHNVYLFFYSTNCFTTVMVRMFVNYKVIVETYDYIQVILSIYCILYVTQFGLTCWICTLASEEFQKTGPLIYEFVLNTKYLNRNCVRNEVNDFSIQLQQHRVAFTACNFFEINSAFFSCFIGVMVTYLLVFIQFYETARDLGILE